MMKMRQVVSIALCSTVLFSAPMAEANWMKERAKKIQEAIEQRAERNRQQDVADEQPDEAPADSVAQDAIEGAAVCGAVTAATGGDARNVAVAGAVCGAGNAAITVLGNRGKKKYAAEYRAITKEQRSIQREIDSLERANERAIQKTGQIQAQVDLLVAQERDSKKFVAKAQKLRKQLDGEIARVRSERTSAQAKLAILDNQTSSLDALIKESPDIEDYQATHSALLAQKEALNDRIRTANGLDDNLVAKKEALDSEIIQRG